MLLIGSLRWGSCGGLLRLNAVRDLGRVSMRMDENSCMQWLAVNPVSFWLPISAMASPNAENENCSTSPCNVPRVESDVTGSLRNNGTFRWTEERDRLLLRQIVSLEPFAYKAGTKEAGLRWTEVAERINCYAHFSSQPRDQRSVRERFNKLLADFKKKSRNEESASGIAPDDQTENEMILEEIVEKMKSPLIQVARDEKNQEKKRQNAIFIRNNAMETWSKTRKSGSEGGDSGSEGNGQVEQALTKRRKTRKGGSEALQYLAEKTEVETALRKQDLELRREEMRLQAEQQKEHYKLKQQQMRLMADIVKRLAK